MKRRACRLRRQVRASGKLSRFGRESTFQTRLENVGTTLSLTPPPYNLNSSLKMIFNPCDGTRSQTKLIDVIFFWCSISEFKDNDLEFDRRITITNIIRNSNDRSIIPELEVAERLKGEWRRLERKIGRFFSNLFLMTEGARSQQFPLSVSPICLQLHRDRVGGSRLLDTEPPRRDTGRSSDSSVS